MNIIPFTGKYMKGQHKNYGLLKNRIGLWFFYNDREQKDIDQLIYYIK